MLSFGQHNYRVPDDGGSIPTSSIHDPFVVQLQTPSATTFIHSILPLVQYPNNPSSTIHHPCHHPLFTIHPVIHLPPSPSRYPSSTIPSSVIHHHHPVIRYPPSPSRYSLSTIAIPLSVIYHRHPVIRHPPSPSRYPLSTINSISVILKLDLSIHAQTFFSDSSENENPE